MKQAYTWVKRATPDQKQQMENVVKSLNELAYEDYDTHGYVPAYKLERCGDAWGVQAYVAKVHPDVGDDFEIGQELYSGSMVRCSHCGGIRELFDGQAEFCTECDRDW